MTRKGLLRRDVSSRVHQGLTLLLVCFLGLIPLAAADGTTLEKERAFQDNFYDVAIQGPLIWIVGYHGTILHSRDRGLSWTVQRSGTSEALFRLSFVNSKVGWVSGSHGTILHTTNGGESWHTQSTPTEEHLLGLQFLDPGTGWAVGSRGTVLHTQNRGATWIKRSLGDDVILNDVSFVTPSEGWVVGEFGRIYHTENGGRNWNREKSPIEVSFVSGKNRNLFRLLLDPRNAEKARPFGWAFGMDGVILKTGRAGRWEVAHQSGVTNGAATNYHLFDAAISQGKKWAVGERGTVIFGDAGAELWTRALLDVSPVGLNGIAFGSHGLGLIVGNRGILIRTENWGKKWMRAHIKPQAFHNRVGKLR